MGKQLTYLDFCKCVFALCTTYHCSVVSWFRTEERNTLKGGGPRSRHLFGLAADLIPDDPERIDEIIGAARAMGLDALFHKGHVHIELDQRNTIDGKDWMPK